jgi:hypothetical protein
MELHRRQFNKGGLSLGALQHYLKSNKAFLGQCKAKKFSNSPYRCWMFDMKQMDVEIPLTSEVLSYQKDEPAPWDAPSPAVLPSALADGTQNSATSATSATEIPFKK